MLYTEGDHPVNQSEAQIIGQVAGNLISGHCTGCEEAYRTDDNIRAFATYDPEFYNHEWNIQATFCDECHPCLTLDSLPESTSGYQHFSAAIIEGSIHKGRKSKIEFCPMHLKDRRANENDSYSIHASHRQNRHYTPATDGKTIPIPINLLETALTNQSLPTNRDESSTERLMKILESKSVPNESLCNIKESLKEI